MKIRLHQFLSKCGIFTSKNEVKNAIWNGEVSVNGLTVKNIKFEFNPNTKHHNIHVQYFQERNLSRATKLETLQDATSSQRASVEAYE